MKIPFNIQSNLTKRFAVAGLVLAAMTMAAAAKANEVVYNKLLPSTVWVRVPGVSRGSGVLVDKARRLVVTNYHVVDDNTKVRVYFPAVSGGNLIMEESYYRTNDSALGISGRVVATLSTKDLALVQLDRLPQGARAVRLSATSARPGQRLHVVANQGGTGALWSYSDGKVRSILNKQYSINIDTNESQKINARVIVTSLAINSGDSGGPVVNDSAELVALVSSGNTKRRLVSTCIDISEIRGMLQRVGINVARLPNAGGLPPVDANPVAQPKTPVQTASVPPQISRVPAATTNPQPPIQPKPQPPAGAKPQLPITPPAKTDPQPPVQNPSLIGLWSGRQVTDGRVVGWGLALLDSGRFSIALVSQGGRKIEKTGTWKLEKGSLTLVADGRVFVRNNVSRIKGDSFNLGPVAFTRVKNRKVSQQSDNSTQAPKALLTGTTWRGNESLQGFGNLAFQFLAGNQAVMADTSGTTRGTWSLNGDIVTLSFSNGQVVYRARVTGETMNGNAANNRGANWTFSLRRVASGVGG